LDFDTLTPSERHELLSAVGMYLNLCSEELYLHERGKVDRETWGIWSAEMRDALRAPWFRAAWGQLRDGDRSYPKFVRFFDAFCEEAVGGEAI